MDHYSTLLTHTTTAEFTKTHTISMVLFSSQFFLATFCPVISRLLDHRPSGFLVCKTILNIGQAGLVTNSSVVSCRDVTGPEKS